MKRVPHAALLVMLFFTVSCTNNASEFLMDRVVEKSITKLLASFPQAKVKGHKIGIVGVQHDSHEMVREELLRQIAKMKMNNFDLLAMPKNKEMDRLLQQHHVQLLYQDIFDESQLIQLGKLLAPDIILVADMQSQSVNAIGARVIVRAKLLDLGNGKILWDGKGQASIHSTTLHIFSLIVLLGVFGFLFFVYLSLNMTTGGYYKTLLRILFLIAYGIFLYFYYIKIVR